MAAEEGQVIACHTEEFDEQMTKCNDSKKLVVINLTASYLGPCRVIAPIFNEKAKRFPNALFLKVDVDELKDVATSYAIEAMPTFLFMKEGKEVDKVVGALKDMLQTTVMKHLTVEFV